MSDNRFGGVGSDLGVSAIYNRQRLIDADLKLPETTVNSPIFLPQTSPMDAVTKRPSLDERLPGLLQPTNIDPDLMYPSVLTATRLSIIETLEVLQRNIQQLPPTHPNLRKRTSIEHAVSILSDHDEWDTLVQQAISALLRA